MKKKIIFGSALVTFLMIMIPSVSSIEYHVVEEEYNSDLMDKIKKIGLIELKEKIDDINKNNIIKNLKEKNINNKPIPTFIFTIFFIIMAIISTILATISAGVMLLVTQISQIVFQVLGSFITTLGKIIMWVLDLIIP